MGKILCPGELLIDFISLNDGKKLADVTSFTKKAGGAPANAAMGMNAFGAEAYFVGAVGKDAFGDFLIGALKAHDLSSKYVKRSDKNTTIAFVSLDENEERTFEFIRGADADLYITDIPEDLLTTCSIFHFGSATAFLEGKLQKTYHKLLDYAEENRKIISFDPNYRDALFGDKQASFVSHSMRFIERSDILKVSEEEAQFITKQNDLNTAVSKLLEIGAKNIFVTIGEKGTLYANSNKREVISSIQVDTVDTTGAGDAFVGTLLGQISNLEKDDLNFEKLKKYTKIANVSAALTVTKKGALESMPSKKEVLSFLQ